MQINEEQRLERRIVSRFRKAISDYQLVTDGDHVLVALSGGKDSLCLLELLARQAHIYRPRFRVEAVHVRMDNIHYETDTSYLERFCKSFDVKLHVLTTRFETNSQNDNKTSLPSSGAEFTSAAAQRKQKTPCFLCSWYRRKAIFNLAQAEGFNKIALGHHQDDILHTALMNLCFQGRFEGMPVFMKMKKMPLAIIRPLCLEHECDIKDFARMREYEQQIKTCPYEHETHRSEIARLYAQVEEMNGEARYSIWHALAEAGKLTDYGNTTEY